MHFNFIETAVMIIQTIFNFHVVKEFAAIFQNICKLSIESNEYFQVIE